MGSRVADTSEMNGITTEPGNYRSSLNQSLKLQKQKQFDVAEDDSTTAFLQANTESNNYNSDAEKTHKFPIDQFIPEQDEETGAGRRDDDDIHRCGLGPFQPHWLQRFATKQAFMIVFSILSVIQGMSWAYSTATITTLEKRFKISSRTIGLISTGNEVSQILFSILISYYGSRGHRPRWIAVGVMFSALSCFVIASPHLFYGPGEEALLLTEEFQYLGDAKPGSANEAFIMGSYLSTTTTEGSDLDFDKFGIGVTDHHQDFAKDEMGNGSRFSADDVNNIPQQLPAAAAANNKRNRVQLCDRHGKPSSNDGGCNRGDLSVVPLILIFLSSFVAGIGVLLFFSLGGPYLDDNVKKTQSPMLFGITMSLRLVGPTLGFLFGSVCLKIYISPKLTPIIKNNDPRWLGAWWLGWICLGTLMLATSFLIAMFPRELPRTLKERKQKLEANKQSRRSSNGLVRSGSIGLSTAELSAMDEVSIPKFSEMKKALTALLKNKVNVFNNLSSVFYLFSAIGYWTYMPKYMETTFMQSAASAAAFSGIVSIAFQAVGLLTSGALISKFRPSARFLAGWNVILGFLDVVMKIVFTQLGCQAGELVHGYKNMDGLGDTESGTWNLTIPCNGDCNCQTNKMLPVCFKEENKLFYSACHAGCTSFDPVNMTATGCSCLPSMAHTVNLGTCSEGCYKIFLTFLAVNAIIKLLDSSGRIGNMLVGYRCVDPKDKSLAIGLGIFLISVFAMLPSPIVFGAIIDSVCQVWGTKCGKKGNCWLYDGTRLRYAFNLTAAGFIFVGAVLDIFVWYYVHDLDLYDEDKNVQNRLDKKRESDKRKSNVTT